MNLKHLSNDQLHAETLRLAEKERLTIIEVLWHLREVERRMLFAQMGYKDLKQYCVCELKYSEGSAWRRINAMRLLKELPEIETKIEKGVLNLTQVSMARSLFRETKPTVEEKKEILSAIENQSTKSTEKILAEKKPEETSPKSQVIERHLKGQRLEVTLVLDQDLQNELEEIQILLGKPMSKLELLRMLTKEKLQNLRSKNQKATSEPVKTVTSSMWGGAQPLAVTQSSRYVSTRTKLTVKNRDGHQCKFVDPKTGRRCVARLNLQFDHIRPFALGGTSAAENLELLCPTHNRLRALSQYGSKKMGRFLPSVR